MTFFLLLKGQGDGCDYTIGCNQTWVQGEVDNYAQALSKAEEIIAGYHHIKIEKAILIVLSPTYGTHEHIDVKAVYAAARDERAKAEKIEEDEALRIQYEKLKQRFG